MPGRHTENSEGDFYTENGVCTACGAPAAEAPDLIDHADYDYGHCYFKKQPQTEDEILKAINATAVSCIGGLRYGGNEERILKRLYEFGCSNQCDNTPVGDYKTVIWNEVCFSFDGSLNELVQLLVAGIGVNHGHVTPRVVSSILRERSFEFVVRWTSGRTGAIFTGQLVESNMFQILLTTEFDGWEASLQLNAILLNGILRSNKNAADILWFDQDGRAYEVPELRWKL